MFERLTAGKQTHEEKINAIYRYVASKAGTGEVPGELLTARMVLEHGAGFCGDLALAMATLVEAGNYATRMIDTSDGAEKPNTHVLVEVFYDGQWNLYDPTYGVIGYQRQGARRASIPYSLPGSHRFSETYRKLSDRERRRWVPIQQKILSTGYHHLYQITKDEEG